MRSIRVLFSFFYLLLLDFNQVFHTLDNRQLLIGVRAIDVSHQSNHKKVKVMKARKMTPLGLSNEQRNMVVMLLCGAVLVVLNQTLLSPALPSIMQHL